MSWALVLTAGPDRGLADDDISAAAAMAGAGAAARLGDCAAEIVLEDKPGQISLPGVDANAVPMAGRSKRLLIADMDSTIIGCECIDELADIAGVGSEVAGITERAMRGEIDFAGALKARVGLLSGLPATALERTFAERVRLNPGAETLVRTMSALGAFTALVSGGFTYFTERVAAAAGFAENRANQLEIVDGKLTGGVCPPILGREAKAEALESYLARLGAAPSEAIALGDGANDLSMISAAGLGIGYRPKPALAAAADAVLLHSDLTAVLHLVGVSERDWVHG